jgi:DNA-directed RNA polymerase specialized sigma24 family protein
MNLDDLFCTTSSTDAIDNKLDAQKAIEKLGHIDRAILYLWVNGFSQLEIAKMFGYSQGHISKLLDRMNRQP